MTRRVLYPFSADAVFSPNILCPLVVEAMCVEAVATEDQLHTLCKSIGGSRL
jgi:hypothetical protein